MKEKKGFTHFFGTSLSYMYNSNKIITLLSCCKVFGKFSSNNFFFFFPLILCFPAYKVCQRVQCDILYTCKPQPKTLTNKGRLSLVIYFWLANWSQIPCSFKSHSCPMWIFLVANQRNNAENSYFVSLSVDYRTIMYTYYCTYNI